jgi:hypothetical protein
MIRSMDTRFLRFLITSPNVQPSNMGQTASTNKAGTARAIPIILSHSAENTGPADCQQIFVERK